MQQIILALAASSLISLVFLAVSVVVNHTLADGYLAGNLLLAWLPLIFAGGLVLALKNHLWLSWRPLVMTVLWLAFLPNSFYMISDLVHLQTVAVHNLLYDSVMFELFIINGLVLGFLSLHFVHQQLKQRLSARSAGWLVALSLFLTSFAIYLGRLQRTSSWNLLTNPTRALFDISSPFVDPAGHGQALTVTLTFFVFLVVVYFAGRRLVNLLARPAGK
ncbi:MAG: DUF1361 domain-containing protein [Candidatus Saccharimonadales bacterium]